MIRWIHAEEMRQIDKNAIQNDTKVGFEYMSRAAQAICTKLQDKLKPRDTICILCGKGNNGGDAWLCAAYLKASGWNPLCVSACDPHDLKGEAKMAWQEAREAKVRWQMELPSGKKVHPTWILDGLTGTGIKGDLRGAILEFAQWANHQKQKYQSQIFAIDTPSGFNNSTLQAGKDTIKADFTLILGYPRPASVTPEGKAYYGKNQWASLDYPEKVFQACFSGLKSWEEEDVLQHFPQRQQNGDKWAQGVTLTIGGSPWMVGAPFFSTAASLRMGTGYSYALIPQCIAKEFNTLLPESVIIPAGAEGVSGEDLNSIAALQQHPHSWVLGPGLGRSPQTTEMVREFLKAIQLPGVIDADGLYHLSKIPDWEKLIPPNCVLTPHQAEFTNLWQEIPEQLNQRINLVQKLAAQSKSVIILKGSLSVIADEKRKYIYYKGTSALARAGSGDVLAGILSSLIAQGCSSINAANIACWIHGKAGRLAAEEFSEYSIFTREIIDCIPFAIQDLWDT